MKPLFSIALLILLFISHTSFSQMKVVIMGSSTAYGSGASSYANSWAGKTESYVNRNTTDGIDTIVYNIASPGYDTYQEMPDGFVPPPGRPLPDQGYNVTKALSYSPDIVIISLPSNDINYGYSKYEMISNLRLMSSTVFAAGAKCYVSTPQPRNDLDQDHRDSLRSLVDSVNMSFGGYAINFWDCLVTNDGLNMLKDEYRAIPSPLHVNDDGHELLFEQVRDHYIFGDAGPLALQLTSFLAQAQNNTVLIKWHTEQQGPNCSFEVQRSADGHLFEPIFNQSIIETRQSADYSTIDQTPFIGKSFYRIKITQAGRQSYSGIISVNTPGKTLSISKLYATNAGSDLSAEINIQKSQLIYINILGSTGNIVSNQSEFINQPTHLVIIPIGKLSSGLYYISISATDGTKIVMPFIK